ncbi:MAG: efflux transporter periplasmic adaptor subunit [Syntrophus sp. RIFOXYC2_FULL_54_9]|nr:MAG: efflux transporter periplasmic adaptor subunit [Syntrophus sp. GWC2_56_31]OHE30226.1 MAG: efflux transporter periplasmic adaptor subunit [Syntrophus sp. RIFOXYC2_FULL_54_9]HBB17808.1 efflux RND transporter periplasmic adaptor subunit [Syntrophus sp. (in: bacteria)]
MKRILLFVFVWALVILTAACSKGGDAAKKATPEVARPPVAVETSVAAAGALTEGIDVTGTLAPKFEVDVKSEVAGLVREVYVTEWVRVKKGEPLARIDIREQESFVKRTEAALGSAKSLELQSRVADNRSRRELERMKKLKENGLATQQALDDAVSEAEAAASRIEAAHAQVRAAEEDLNQVRTRLAKGRIAAPIDGIVSERRANVGDLVGEAGANQPLFHIVDNRVLNLTVSVPSTAMASLRRDQPLEFTTDALPGRTFKGTVMFINPAVNESDRSVRVIAEVNNTAGELKGGLFVQGRIVTGKRGGVIFVPREALLGWDVAGRRAKLFIVEADRAISREVRTGQATEGRVEITAGLKAAETYVVRGAFNVKEGDMLIIAGKQGS